MAEESRPLTERRCVRCEPGTPSLERPAIDSFLPEVPDWTVTEMDGHTLISRRFKFKGFMPAIAFVNRVATLAEDEGHHPDVCLGWGYVTVQLWTHAAGGLTDNDFILAAKIDQVQSPKS